MAEGAGCGGHNKKASDAERKGAREEKKNALA